jgi:putative flippase GtrA
MGGVGTVAHYAVLVALVHLAGLAPVPASTVGAVVGAFVNYTLNYRFTFASRRSHGVALPRFMVIAGLGILVNAAVMASVLAVLTNVYLVAQVVATGAVLLFGYLANRKWTF